MDPHAAFLEVFKNAKTKNVDFELACNYSFYRKQYGRWHQQRFDHCTLQSIAEKYRTLYCEDIRWLDHSDKDVAVFATADIYRQMANCKILVADATFATCPEGLRQVFVIHGLVENEKGAEWVPLLLAIMKKKTEINYEKVMDCIKKAWTRLDIKPVTERVHCDYEAAEGNALKNLFGIEKIFGCYFHYNQIIIKKLDYFKFKYAYLMIKGDKAIPEYRSIRTWIRCMMALPLLPKEYAKFLWEAVLHELPKPPKSENDLYWPTEEMEKFKAYFIKNWINFLNFDSSDFEEPESIKNLWHITACYELELKSQKFFGFVPKYMGH
uniref:MULE transposase domain-containing protein n=1 Tax=Panagrolaimus superbus TaxID=310955 RepID=A0A914YU35_9BILA